MKLRRNQLCPIHRSLFCCGREQIQRQRTLQPGIRRVEDPHHQRGYRELRSPAEMRKVLNRKIRHLRHLPRRVHGLQRHRARPQEPERNGRSLARRPSG